MLIFSHVWWRMDLLEDCVAATTEKGRKEASPWIFSKQEEEDTRGRCGPEGHRVHPLRKISFTTVGSQAPRELEFQPGFSMASQVDRLGSQAFLTSKALVA